MLPGGFASASGVVLIVSVIYLLLTLITIGNIGENVCIDKFKFPDPPEFLATDVPWYSSMPAGVRERGSLFSFEWFILFKSAQIRAFVYCVVTLLVLVGIDKPWGWAVGFLILLVATVFDALKMLYGIYLIFDCINVPFCWTQTAPHGSDGIFTGTLWSPNVYFRWYLLFSFGQLVCSLILVILLPGLRQIVQQYAPSREGQPGDASTGASGDMYDEDPTLDSSKRGAGYLSVFYTTPNIIASKSNLSTKMQEKGLRQRRQKKIKVVNLLALDVHDIDG